MNVKSLSHYTVANATATSLNVTNGISSASTTVTGTSTTGGLFANTAVGTRPWFLVARERNHTAGPAELPALTRELHPEGGTRALRYIDLAVPVQAADGALLGALGAHVSWEWSREVQLSVVPESARRERIGVTVYSAAGEVLLDSGGSGWSQPPEPPVISDPRKFRGTLLQSADGGTSNSGTRSTTSATQSRRIW